MVPTEFQEQATVIEWATVTRCIFNGRVESVSAWLYAVPNGEVFNSGGFTNVQRMSRWRRLSRLGFKSGLPDLYFDLPCGPYHGWRHEMKKRGERPSREQTARLDLMVEAGYCAGWSDSATKAIASLQSYIALGPFVAG